MILAGDPLTDCPRIARLETSDAAVRRSDAAAPSCHGWPDAIVGAGCDFASIATVLETMCFGCRTTRSSGKSVPKKLVCPHQGFRSSPPSGDARCSP